MVPVPTVAAAAAGGGRAHRVGGAGGGPTTEAPPNDHVDSAQEQHEDAAHLRTWRGMEVRASLVRRPGIRLSQLSAWDHELQSGVRVCRHGRDIRHAGSEGAAHVQSDPGAVLLVVGHEGVIGHGPAEAHQDGPHIREERGGVSRPGREKPSEDGCRQQYG